MFHTYIYIYIYAQIGVGRSQLPAQVRKISMGKGNIVEPDLMMLAALIQPNATPTKAHDNFRTPSLAMRVIIQIGPEPVPVPKLVVCLIPARTVLWEFTHHHWSRVWVRQESGPRASGGVYINIYITSGPPFVRSPAGPEPGTRGGA